MDRRDRRVVGGDADPFTLGASSSPDPRAAPYATVVRSECFDATNGETLRVCVGIWPDALPDTFPLEEFTQSQEAFTESRNACFVIVTPSGLAALTSKAVPKSTRAGGTISRLRATSEVPRERSETVPG